MRRYLKFTTALAIAGTAGYALRRWGRDRPDADDVDRIGYPPLDVLKPVGENVWIVDSGPIRPAGLSVPIRMTVIRLAEGELMLHSPTQVTEPLIAELERLGPVRHLLAPTIGHWTFLPDWQRAFPKAEVWAVPALRERPQVRSSDLRIDHDLDDSAPQPWAQEIEQSLVRGGGGFEEACFFHRPSRILLLADLVQNLESRKLPPGTALAAELARSTGGRTPAHVRAALLAGGKRVRESIRDLTAHEPEKVIFAHGDWFDKRAAERLRQAFAWLP